MLTTPAVSKYMTKGVWTIAPDETLVAARQLMSAHNVRHLPVVVDGGRLVGIVTERDLFLMTTFHKLDASVATVRIAMTPEPVCVREDEPLAAAASKLDRRKISSALVTDRDGRLIGIFTEADAMRALATELTPR